MADRSKESMRVDRRLLERPGWISRAELTRELDALPDVSNKIDPREDDPAGESSAEAPGSSGTTGGSSSPQSMNPIPAPQRDDRGSTPPSGTGSGGMETPPAAPGSDRGPGEGGGGGFSPAN